ncbi:MAG TPA: V-type ATP synthase subunit F [Gemmatimonadales bacterium]|jgi:vacuolar-type H+-ATPase subunit F/Vma7
MGYGVRVLARPEIGVGFALAGLRPVEATSAEQGRDRLRELLELSDVGVILMEGQLYDQLPEELRRQLGRRPLPMVVPFPEPAWAPGGESADAYIVELLRQVIGYRVRIT